MIKKSTKINLFLLISFLFGLLYFYFIHTSLKKIDPSHFTVVSKIEQVKRFHIRRENNQSTLQCNHQDLTFVNQKEKGYWYHGTESIDIPLYQGENNCYGTNLSGEVAQKLNYIEFFILFILSGIPLIHLLFQLLLIGLNYLKSFNKKNNNPTPWHEQSFFSNKSILLIILLGIILRIVYFEKYGVTLFQHDWHGHIEFIKYIANGGILPIPTKGLEYPQQPLYYLVTGNLYHFLNSIGWNDNEKLMGIGYLSLFGSIIFLVYGYKVLNLLTKNYFVQITAMLFLAFTPSLVYLSARINNDSLLIALATLTLYYSIKSFQNQFKTYFYHALLFLSLLFLTKVSAAGFELFLFALLIKSYHQAEPIHTLAIKKKLYLFSLLGVLLLSFTFLRIYLPLEESFYMVNSSGNYPNQTLQTLDVNYFGSFHILELLKAGQSHVFGEDSIRYSFFTYQYGTMLLGEFDYQYFIDKSPILHITMQAMILFALIYLMGFITYLINFYKESFLSQLLFALIGINFLLILKFIFDYPSVCNTDFRYFVSSFVILSFIVAQGLSYLTFMRKAIMVIMALLTVSEIIFFIELLR
jgi:hypothetical protein